MNQDTSKTRVQISIPQEKIAEFCRKHYISKLAVFGSAMRTDFRDDSDIDVLVEFDPGPHSETGLFHHAGWIVGNSRSQGGP